MKKLIFSLIFVFTGVFGFASESNNSNLSEIEFVIKDPGTICTDDNEFKSVGVCEFIIIHETEEEIEVHYFYYDNIADPENCDKFKDSIEKAMFG